MGLGLGRDCRGHGTENTLGRLWGAGRLLNRAVKIRPVPGKQWGGAILMEGSWGAEGGGQSVKEMGGECGLEVGGCSVVR